MDCSRCTLDSVTALETIVADLRSLPASKLQVAAEFVQQLKRISREERQVILNRTAGALSTDEADELDRVINEGCENIDERDW